VYDMLDDDDMEAGQHSIEEFGDLREAGEGAVEQGESPEPAAVTESKWKQAAAAAAQSGLLQGDLPQELLRLIDKIIHPEVSITKYLRDFVDRTARNDYNWSIPNRRYITYGAILPSLISDELPEFVMVFDTSGSIDPDSIQLMAGHLDDVLRTYNTAVTVLYVDTKVHQVERFVSGDIVNLRPQGGGGTDFRPAFRWVEDQGMRPSCLIYLTDAFGAFPGAPPEYPVLWVIVSVHGIRTEEQIRNIPFGAVITAASWT
jgi:predicted metal-dependent peptidase